MAITWDLSITNVDVVNKRADVSYTRADDITGKTEYYSFKKVIVETPQQRAALQDLVWSKHEEAIANQTAIDNFITNLEQAGKIDLESREV